MFFDMGRQRVRLEVQKVSGSPSRLKRIGNAHLGEEHTQDIDWWTEEDSVWWSKGKKGRKGHSKGKSKFPNFNSHTFLRQGKGSDREFQSNKGTSKDQNRSYSQSGFSALESPSEKGGHWESVEWHSISFDDSSSSTTRGIAAWYGTRQTAWMAAIPSNLSNTQRMLFWILVVPHQLDQERRLKRFQKMRCIMALRQSFAPATNPFCLPTLRWRLAWEVVFFIFQRNLHIQPELKCLKQMYPSYSHFRK